MALAALFLIGEARRVHWMPMNSPLCRNRSSLCRASANAVAPLSQAQPSIGMGKKTLAMGTLVACLSACGGAQSRSASSPAAPTAAVPHVEGDHLVSPEGHPLLLRGVAFGNRVWVNDRIPRDHHDERDYARVQALGMNAVRFYLNYQTFESDAAPGQWLEDGFQWLDQNVAWAKKHGVYLILNMHVPPGGYQSLGKGKALWNDPALQGRFAALWRAIAERYRSEPIIAGYDLLNEPVVEHGIADWKSLAEKTIAAVREVDPNHAIFVERVNAIAGDWSEDTNRNFFRVADPNVVYEFHFYKPFHFTHQNAPWVDFAAAQGRYPDPTIAEVEWFNLTFETATFNNPRLPAGDSDWQYFEGKPFTVTDPKWVVAKPSLDGSSLGQGRAYYDDLVLERLDAAGQPVETLRQVNLDTPRGWYHWKKTGGGSVSLANQGHGDGSSLVVTGTSDLANLGADFLRFIPAQGATYRISGWMKGEKVPPSANCQFRLDFSSSTVPVRPRDRTFLAQELGAYVAWGKKQGVPLFLGEFGVTKFAFEGDNGGLRWVSDMLDLLAAQNLNYTYHDYHETFMGLYFGDNTLPDPKNANQPLLDLFRQKLGGTAPRE